MIGGHALAGLADLAAMRRVRDRRDGAGYGRAIRYLNLFSIR